MPNRNRWQVPEKVSYGDFTWPCGKPESRENEQTVFGVISWAVLPILWHNSRIPSRKVVGVSFQEATSLTKKKKNPRYIIVSVSTTTDDSFIFKRTASSQKADNRPNLTYFDKFDEPIWWT